MAGQRKLVRRRTASSPKAEFRTLTETAQILGLGINQAAQAIARGEIRAIKIGKQYRISDDEIARLKRGETTAA
jgi:excisionase family DNA binding protein